MSRSCRYGMLASSLLGYLVPWVWVRGFYGAARIPAARSVPAAAVSGRLVVGDAVLSTAREVAVTRGYVLVLCVTGIWLAVAALAMLLRCREYLRGRRRLMAYAEACGAEVPEGLVLRLAEECHIRRRVRIVRIPGGSHSFTLGCLRPVVFLQDGYRPQELEHILRHEFTHIARGDLLVKMLMQLVCCLHWFNPLAIWVNSCLRMCSSSCGL